MNPSPGYSGGVAFRTFSPSCVAWIQTLDFLEICEGTLKRESSVVLKSAPKTLWVYVESSQNRSLGQAERAVWL